MICLGQPTNEDNNKITKFFKSTLFDTTPQEQCNAAKWELNSYEKTEIN